MTPTSAQLRDVREARLVIRDALKVIPHGEVQEALGSAMLEAFEPELAHVHAQGVERMIDRGRPA